jgi:ABC-type antimicrobial peptide transport system permease subunit
MLALLSGVFGAVALALSVLGLYGVMAYSVVRRRNEIGVRIALGADRRHVLRMVLGDVARIMVIGLAFGVAGALAAGRLVSSFLFGLQATDPAIIAFATGVMAFVALAAGFVPAWRASRVDPLTTLREE